MLQEREREREGERGRERERGEGERGERREEEEEREREGGRESLKEFLDNGESGAERTCCWVFIAKQRMNVGR